MAATTNCKVYLRSGPRNVFCYPVTSIERGANLTVLERSGEWLRVSVNDKVGYLRKSSVELDSSEEDKYYELPEMLRKELEQVRAARTPPCGRYEPLAAKESKDQVETSPEGPEERKDEADTGLDPERKKLRFSALLPSLHGAKLSALCLSGGGIRSATFNLGVLQGLARCGALKEVDYLSTVSGGGYIGSWLSSWISRVPLDTPVERFDHVVDTLAQDGHGDRCEEPYQIKFLRDYSNYLTPRVGFFSVDTWAIIGTYLRNLILNWLVLLPLLFAVLLVPRLLTNLIAAAGSTEAAAYRSLAAGTLFGLLPIVYTVGDLPSVGDLRLEKGYFTWFFLVPLVLMACFLSGYWGYCYLPGCPDVPGIGTLALFGTGLYLAGWVLGLFLLRAKHGIKTGCCALCAAVTGAIAGCLGWVVFAKLMPALLQMVSHPKLLFVTLSVPLIIAVYLLTMTLMVASVSHWTVEQDREWWGRAAGIVLLAGLAWGGGMAAVIYGPWLILPQALDFWNKIYALLGGGAGIAVAILGRDPSTPAMRPGVPLAKKRTTLLSAAALLFLLFLTQSLSLFASWILWLNTYVRESLPCLSITPFLCNQFPELTRARIPLDFQTHLDLACTPPGWMPLLLLAATLASLLMALLVNINKFSMHAMYRNRLVRCYLGASRSKGDRDCQPFTGFDDKDDRFLRELPRRPFHIVNMAWNLVKGRRLAWQQRKAASFIMSPLFAGSDIEPDPHCRKMKIQPGGYRSIETYGACEAGKKPEPMLLGTAMAISGAAASPNMGYHSSPLVTFVMAFFNVRLGWWLGNPGTGLGSAWRRASPTLAVLPLLKETFGFTREESSDIYLSDGGHFENLGLYEMVRRRCHYLVASDAGCDRDSVFQDLGNAVRKVRADFGIEIDIDLAALRAGKLHFAVGVVKYGCCDEGALDGRLLYLKPVLSDDESADLLNYAKMHREFPHEPTSDQWFDEAQFESYRKLGLHALTKLTEGQRLDLEDLFNRASRMHKKALKQVEEEKEEARHHCSTRPSHL